MAATPSIKITMSSPYKGGTKEWSNRYHFNGGTPAASADWLALFTDITADFKNSIPADTTIIEGTGYAAGSDVPVWTHTSSIAGIMTAGGSSRRQALETVALIRWDTTARSTKNHPVYLFTYVHAVFTSTATNETLESGQKGDLESFATHWITGFTDGTNTYVRAGPNGATGTARTVETYVTHRDFPR